MAAVEVVTGLEEATAAEFAVRAAAELRAISRTFCGEKGEVERGRERESIDRQQRMVRE